MVDSQTQVSLPCLGLYTHSCEQLLEKEIVGKEELMTSNLSVPCVHQEALSDSHLPLCPSRLSLLSSIMAYYITLQMRLSPANRNTLRAGVMCPSLMQCPASTAQNK